MICGRARVEPATPGSAVRLALDARRLSRNVYMNRRMTKPKNGHCAQRRHRSAWASAQSDQSLRCPHQETLGPQLPIERTAKTLIRLGGCQADLSLRWAQRPFCWFCHEVAHIQKMLSYLR